MSRVKRGVAAHKKHKKLLSQAEGRRASKHKLVRPAREAAMHALRYAYRDRRARKGQFRALWIARINAAAREAGVSYGRLRTASRFWGINLDGKVLAAMLSAIPRYFGTTSISSKRSRKSHQASAIRRRRRAVPRNAAHQRDRSR